MMNCWLPRTASTAGSSMPDDRNRIRPEEALAEFAADVSEPVPAAGNLPTFLHDPGVAWYVEAGALDVFVAEYRDGAAESALKHVVRATAGRLVFGNTEHRNASGLSTIAKGLASSQLRRVPIDKLLGRIAEDPEAEALSRALAAQVDAWIKDLSGAVAREIKPRPQIDLMVAPQTQVTAEGVLVGRTGRGLGRVGALAGRGLGRGRALAGRVPGDGGSPARRPRIDAGDSGNVDQIFIAVRYRVRVHCGVGGRDPDVARAAGIPPLGARGRSAQPHDAARRCDQFAGRPS